MPRQVEQRKASLTAHGQLTTLVVVRRSSGLELIDGFKRHLKACMTDQSSLRPSPRANLIAPPASELVEAPSKPSADGIPALARRRAQRGLGGVSNLRSPRRAGGVFSRGE